VGKEDEITTTGGNPTENMTFGGDMTKIDGGDDDEELGDEDLINLLGDLSEGATSE